MQKVDAAMWLLLSEEQKSALRRGERLPVEDSCPDEGHPDYEPDEEKSSV